MSVGTRRILYSMLAALGFGLIVPFAINLRLWQAELPSRGPIGLQSAVDPSEWTQPMALALIGLLIAGGFLYAAVSVGYPRAWRPLENSIIRCRRCGAEVGFGVSRCSGCDQHLTW